MRHGMPCFCARFFLCLLAFVFLALGFKKNKKIKTGLLLMLFWLAGAEPGREPGAALVVAGFRFGPIMRDVRSPKGDHAPPSCFLLVRRMRHWVALPFWRGGVNSQRPTVAEVS